jgi:hypothetical protein
MSDSRFRAQFPLFGLGYLRHKHELTVNFITPLDWTLELELVYSNYVGLATPN